MIVTTQRMVCTKTVLWDCWGTFVVAFKEGDEVDVNLSQDVDGETINGFATSPDYNVSDYVPLGHFAKLENNHDV